MRPVSTFLIMQLSNSRYIGLSILTGNYIKKDFPCGFIDKPVEVRRKNKELVILYDGDEI